MVPPDIRPSLPSTALGQEEGPKGIPDEVWGVTGISIYEQRYLETKYAKNPQGLADTVRSLISQGLLKASSPETQATINEFLGT